MRANYVGNTALQERLHRPEPEVRAIVEAVVVSNADTRETQGDWAGSGTGLTRPQIGGARLIRDTDATHAQHDTASADQENTATDLDNTSPWLMLELEWTDTDAPDFEIHSFTTTLDPDVDDAGRDVSEFRAQLYRVATESENEYTLEQISAQSVVEVSGNSQADFSFDFSGSDVGSPPDPGDSPAGEDDFDPSTNPITIIKVWAVASDGTAAGNCAWVGDNDDSASGTLVTDGTSNVATARFRDLRAVDDAQQVNTGGRFEKFGVGSGIPDFSLTGKSYTEATATFTGIDLGSAPAADTDIVVVAQGEEPSDSSLTWEISDDSGATWTEVVDGDVVGEDNTPDGNDLSGVSRQQTYQMRVTLTPSTDGHTSPFARRIGVEELTTTNLDGVASVEDAGNWSFDPVTLVGEIPEATISLLKEGVRDYRSQGEKLFADNHIGDMSFRVWIGHPDLPRKNWLLVETFDVDDTKPGGAAVDAICLSPLRRLKTPIPPYDEGANERTPVTYTNQTLKQAWDDLLDSQVALPGRFRGPGVEEQVPDRTGTMVTPQTVSKTLRDSDGKTELDAIAHIAGGAAITSQGRVKFQRAFIYGRGSVRASFSREEIQVKGVTPGFRNRIDEYFVPYAYDSDRDDFDAEARSFYGPSINKLGGKGLDTDGEVDESVARWLPNPTKDPSTMTDAEKTDPSVYLAGHVAHRTASKDGVGPGLKQVRFESVIPHPELEPGDPVVVETDQLVIKDPATDTAFRGLLWLTGVVQTQHDIWGREFTVWVQQIEDATPSEEDSDRDTGSGGPAKITFSEDRAAGNATVTANITGPGSYDVTVYRMDTDGTETQVASATGVTDGGGSDPVTHTESLRESEVLPMRVEVTSSTGKLVQVDTATMDSDKLADTTLSVHVQDDGTPVAQGRMDRDGTGGVIHLTQSTGSSPTATDPDGTENTVNLAAGERAWEHVFAATVAKGDDISVKARPEASDGTLSPTDRIVEVGDSRTGTGSTAERRPDITLARGTQTSSTQDYDLTVTSSPDAPSGGVEYRWRATNSPTSSENTFSVWTSITDGTTQSDEISVDRSGSQPSILIVEARDTNVSGNPSDRAVMEVPPNLDGLDDSSSGKLDEGTAVAGGGGVFVKSATSDPDDARAVPYQDGTAVEDLQPAESGAEINKASLDSFTGSVGDDGTDDNYRASWSPGENVADGSHQLKVDYIDDTSTLLNTNTITDPATTNTDSYTETGAGGDPGAVHKIALRLQDDATATTINRYEMSIVSEDTSGGGGGGDGTQPPQ